MSRINRVYVRLAEIYAYDGQLEDFKSRMQKLVEAGKSKEEAVLVLALEKGLWIPEVEELLKKGESREKAISKVAKTMKIETSTEEELKELEATVKRELATTKRKYLELPAPPAKEFAKAKLLLIASVLVALVGLPFFLLGILSLVISLGLGLFGWGFTILGILLFVAAIRLYARSQRPAK